LAARAHAPSDTIVDSRSVDDFAWSIRAIAGAEEPGDHFNLDTFSWGTGTEPLDSRKLLLYGVPVHAGAQRGSEISETDLELATSLAK
jgi:hypothetical protein